LPKNPFYRFCRLQNAKNEHANKKFVFSDGADTSKELLLDPKVTLLTQPGTILAAGLLTEPDVALRNALNIDSLDDPLTPVQAILNRCPKSFLMLHFKIPDFADVDQFLKSVQAALSPMRHLCRPSLDLGYMRSVGQARRLGR
jgi:nuclear GTP-binding protein